MLYIVRHGQTANNKARLLQGRSDIPLNDTGIAQAEEVRDWCRKHALTFDKVYTSPLIRAVETARIIAGRDDMVCDDRLLEMNYGPYEGMDLHDPTPEVAAFFRDFVHQSAPEGMEPLAQVVARLGSFLEEIREESIGRNVLLSTHAIAMKGALEYLTPDSQGRYWSTHIVNCAVYAADQDPAGKWMVPQELRIHE